VDAIVSMEGSGPSAGEPCFLGYVIAGKNGLGVDWIASQICGFNPLEVYTNLAGVREGLIRGKEIEVSGLSVKEATVPHFKHPPPDLFDKIPPFLRHRVRKFTTPSPYLRFEERCTKCSVCKSNCPSKAISLSPFPTFDYDKCIRCYCCHELCPENVIDLKVPFLSRLFAS
jgi:ferredoxin